MYECNRRSRCKNVVFSSYSPESLGLFYLNLTKSILGLMRFKFCLCDGPRSLSKGDHLELMKNCWHFQEIFFS